MSSVRRMSTQRLLALAGGLAALVAVAAVLATSALSSGGAVPPAKPLATAVHDALAAPAVPGLSARITFTNKLVDSSSLPTGSPLLKGATGRLWASGDGRARLELQSDNGDAQIVLGTDKVTVYDQQSNTVYEAKLPARDTAKADKHQVPTLADIQQRLTDAMGQLQFSGAQPSNVHGISAYTVRVAPRHDGGLVGAAEVAWDAATGVPLRAAVYQQGSSKPVLELAITNLTYGTVSAQDLTATPPAGAKVTTIDLTGQAAGQGATSGAGGKDVTGLKAVSAAVPFTLSAPDTLVGLPRQDVRLVSTGDGEHGALVTYGKGLGGIAVLQTVAGKDKAASGKAGDTFAGLPQISINGTTGQELATALGTVVRFDRAGVQYIVAGSVPPAAAEAAARGL
ncbi:MAG: outer rane lipoprotein carrier protein LolA [Solirubrobacterales bacterium]|nr:outer rane lipoprotein carrier protein LolA [Solirubrobacterales bacterium]